MRWTRRPCPAVIVMSAATALCADAAGPKRSGQEKRSTWLVMPTFSSNSELGTSLGLMAAYRHYFNGRSQVSMFCVNGMYTSTDSAIVGLVGNVSWSADDHVRRRTTGRSKDYEQETGS